MLHQNGSERVISERVIGKLVGDERPELRLRIMKRLAEPHAYNLDGEFASLFARLTGRPETHVLSQVRELTAMRLEDFRGRDRHARAVRSAVDSIWSAYNEATDTGNLLADTDATLLFLETHDPAITWAVLLGQQDAALEALGKSLVAALAEKEAKAE